MSSQYSDGGSNSNAGDYSTLGDYYKAVTPTRPSFLSYIPQPGDKMYLNMDRTENERVPNYVPKTYNVLETGNYRTVNNYSNMQRRNGN